MNMKDKIVPQHLMFMSIKGEYTYSKFQVLYISFLSFVKYSPFGWKIIYMNQILKQNDATE